MIELQQPVLEGADPLLTAAVVILAGVAFGAVARALKLPSITGQILIGIGIGSYGLHLFDHEALESLQPITHFALGLMAVAVGAHLNVRRLRNAGTRLLLMLLFEATVTPILVFGTLMLFPGMHWTTALLLGGLAVSTAPATVVLVVNEARAKGVFVKTLMGAVALNNIACIFLFEVARAAAADHFAPQHAPELADSLAVPSLMLLKAIALGTAAAVFMNLVRRLVARPDVIATAAVLTILLTSGISDYLGVSPLLSCLFLGIVQTNISREREHLVDMVFSNFQPAILAVFFTLAGMHLSFEHIAKAGTLAAALFTARAVGKQLSANWAMRIAGATERVRRYLGMALVPQAGVAIGLVILVRDDPAFASQPDLVDLLTAVVLTAVTAAELIGPILTRRALERCGEAGMDRSRLLDFIQEEHIVTDLQADSKREAIAALVDRMLRTHDLAVDRETLLRGVLDREAQSSTCFGGGLSVPHAILPDDHPMVGVMGLSRVGLDFKTPDDRPVYCMVLLGTAEGERNRHLQVLAALAATIGRDPDFQERLVQSLSPAHAYEVLHGDDAEDFNYFLEG